MTEDFEEVIVVTQDMLKEIVQSPVVRVEHFPKGTITWPRMNFVELTITYKHKEQNWLQQSQYEWGFWSQLDAEEVATGVLSMISNELEYISDPE